MMLIHAFPPFALLLVMLISPAYSADERDKKSEELKWAKGVAMDFFDSAFSGHIEQAESLIDSSLKAILAKDGEKRMSEWLNNSIAIQGYHSPVIRSEKIAPDQDEASFQGTFQRKEKTFEFSLRVVKDKENRKWRVCYFHFKDRAEKSK